MKHYYVLAIFNGVFIVLGMILMYCLSPAVVLGIVLIASALTLVEFDLVNKGFLEAFEEYLVRESSSRGVGNEKYQ